MILTGDLDPKATPSRVTRSSLNKKITLLKKKPMEKLFRKFPESYPVVQVLNGIYLKKLSIKPENVGKIMRTLLVHLEFTPEPSEKAMKFTADFIKQQFKNKSIEEIIYSAFS